MKNWYAVQVGDNFDCGDGSYTDWQARIENLSSYMASKGVSYKNHLATIRDYDEAVAMAESEAAWHPEEEIRIAVCSDGSDYVEREIIIKEGTR